MMRLPLCDADRSLLVSLDLQDRFIAAVAGGSATSLINNASRLLQAAQVLSIPSLFTEQYSGKLGHTHPTLLEASSDDSLRVEKTSFSAFANDTFVQYIEMSGKTDIILCGLEAHASVLQTASELLQAGYQVYVVEDAVCSRKDSNKHNAMQRLTCNQVQVTNTESVLFEWLRDSKHPKFREIIKNLIKQY